MLNDNNQARKAIEDSAALARQDGAVKFNPHPPGSAEHDAYEAGWGRPPAEEKLQRLPALQVNQASGYVELHPANFPLEKLYVGALRQREGSLVLERINSVLAHIEPGLHDELDKQLQALAQSMGREYRVPPVQQVAVEPVRTIKLKLSDIAHTRSGAHPDEHAAYQRILAHEVPLAAAIAKHGLESITSPISGYSYYLVDLDQEHFTLMCAAGPSRGDRLADGMNLDQIEGLAADDLNSIADAQQAFIAAPAFLAGAYPSVRPEWLDDDTVAEWLADPAAQWVEVQAPQTDLMEDYLSSKQREVLAYLAENGIPDAQFWSPTELRVWGRPDCGLRQLTEKAGINWGGGGVGGNYAYSQVRPDLFQARTRRLPQELKEELDQARAKLLADGWRSNDRFPALFHRGNEVFQLPQDTLDKLPLGEHSVGQPRDHGRKLPVGAKEEQFEVGGVAFAAVQELHPRLPDTKIWLLKIVETGQVLQPGTGEVSNVSIPKMKRDLEDILMIASKNDRADFRRAWG